ncbi:murein L,D-transpeptidase catalytic domain family protein [Segetibacter sp. 3557_3]|uniref:murein L,D-transpeptidase catalytic domain family protein n=1 Tax=Segetibacter sp. 3557_3 TaxID=2547429 RepID=UPI0010585D53|nr:murein L,D-transpeptidase catalytic domain family protein [Segetibacter sp. 3557_3]TDH23970.1 murein L,D-transpeptidase catalytic domain family protein [Segetibacter sp. 3557_3]
MNRRFRKKLSVIASSVLLLPFAFGYAKSSVKHGKRKASVSVSARKKAPGEKTTTADLATKVKGNVYESLGLGKLGLSKQAFDYAIKGHDYLAANGKLQNGDIISIVDFSLPSSQKRLFILDLKNNKLLFHTYVSHGRGSGKLMATDFSNVAESFKSSLGFYVTGDTYMGKHGLSMRLLGQDKGFNDNANDRAVVMHSASYVSEAVVKAQGFIGRSLGCPAVPEALNKPIIETVKNGSCLFLYSPDKQYAANSAIINALA